MASVEELQAVLAKVEAERDELKRALATAQAAPYAEWTLRERTPIKDILLRSDGGVGLVGGVIGLAGWVRSSRMAAKDTLCFLRVSDGSTFEGIQVVIEAATPGFEYVKDKSVTLSASVFIIGKLVDSPGKGQRVELKAYELRLCGPSDAVAYPLANQEHTLEHLRSIAHLRPRTQLIASVTRVRNALAFATHQFFQEQGYYYVNTPLITASDCEGAGEMFQVTTLLGAAEDTGIKLKTLPSGKIDYSQDFFKRPAFLTVSGQLNAEIYATAIGSVYTFGPTFRAEDSNTSRHLAEFWMIEPEIAFADLRENMEIAEGYVRFVLKYAMERCPEDLIYLENYEKKVLAARQAENTAAAKAQEKGSKDKQKLLKQVRDFKSTPLRERLQAIVDSNFARCTYTQAIELLEKAIKEGHQFIVIPKWGDDLGSEHERYLAEEHFKRPVIVYNYPKGFKAFYMRLNDDEQTVAAMDVLVPGIGELIGGSQREERLDVLERRIVEHGLDPVTYSWYLDLRRFGTVVHSGFGLGFERLVCYATGMENIREAIPFPRWPGHAEY